MKRSFIADDIDREFRIKKYYEKKRQKCKDKECNKCKFEDVCTEGGMNAKSL